MTEYIEAKKSIWTPGVPIFADTPIRKYVLAAAIVVMSVFLVVLAQSGRQRLLENKLYHQAFELQESGQAPEAIKAYKKLLSLNPEHAEANVGLGLLEVRKDPRQAISRYKKAIATDPGKADYYSWLAYAYFNGLKKPVEAMDSINKAIEIAPRNYQYHLAAGIFLKKSGRLDEAINELETVVKLEPMFFAAKKRLDRLYAERRRTTEFR